MEIVPAIDIIEGKCVRLTGGDYGKKSIYYEDPLTAAREFEQHGLKRLHLVDLDGAKAGGIVNRNVLERIAGGTSLIIDFGGGVKRDEDIRAAFESGAAMVTGGSIAVRDPERFLAWLEEWGPERIILGADARDGYIAVGGWQESSRKPLLPFVLDYLDLGIRKVICTDIARDGMMSGSSLTLYTELIQAAREAGQPGMELTASGGVTDLAELDCLEASGLSAAIIGKAIYEGSITLDALGDWVHQHEHTVPDTSARQAKESEIRS